ncbi:BNR repeat-containing protein [Thermasporomyces composti]|uniref:Putative BNR repeat neuraminidase n=1 Tax=Thermasporomyces composti TaxID=696763 RepID=A0A3D9V7H8_THECX|nr:BNR repeat-containing protein [Thermasporomyces composti]REF37266.1 putative BNR repeat neuraminidase [Thermasporomyces composti]
MPDDRSRARALRRRDVLKGGVVVAGATVGLGHTTPAFADNAEDDVLTWSDDFVRPDGDKIGHGWRELRGDWAIVDSTLRTTGGPGERIAAQTGFELGRTFSVEASLGSYDTTARRWNGLAVNIVDNGDGTQDYYALRFVTSEPGRPSAWQFLQVTGSVVDNASLLDQGEVPIENGRDYVVRVSTTSYGLFEIAVLDGETELVRRSLVTPLNALLAGGYAGVYSSAGNLRVSWIRVHTSTTPAAPPDPGPLECPPVVDRPYELPDERETVVATSVVDTTWAGHPVGQSLLTDGTTQYVAYYNAERQMVVAQRDITSDTWIKQPLDTFVGWDSHNYVTMALDRDGHLHVSGNMHVVPLIYFRTTRPGDVTSLVRVPTMVDPATEQRVTYPRFLRDAEGALVFRYRDGASGDGRDLYNVYDEVTQRWQRLLDQPLHDGEGLRNAYVEGPVLGPDGYHHIAWVWRDTPDAATNQHLSYARSRDLVHWETSDGTPLDLPITYATGEVVDPVPMNGGIINGNTKVGFDAEGRVVLSYHKYDEEGNTQVYVARRDRTRWTIRQVSRWRGRWTIGGRGSLVFEVRLSPVSVLPDGLLRLDFVCHDTRRTWVLNRALRPVAEVDTPALPREITDVRSDFPGMQVNVAADLATTQDAAARYLLRWESLPTNQDQPRDPPYPEPGPLEVCLLREESS